MEIRVPVPNLYCQFADLSNHDGHKCKAETMHAPSENALIVVVAVVTDVTPSSPTSQFRCQRYLACHLERTAAALNLWKSNVCLLGNKIIYCRCCMYCLFFNILLGNSSFKYKVDGISLLNLTPISFGFEYLSVG